MTDSTANESADLTASATETTEVVVPETQVVPADSTKVYDETYVKDLRTESAGYRKKAKDYEASLTTTQTELASTKETLAALEKRASEAESLATRYKVALNAGLPKNLADRLKGASEEELLADAEELKKFLKPSNPLVLDQGNKTAPRVEKPGMSDILRGLKNK